MIPNKITLSKEEAIEIIEESIPVSTGTWKWGSLENYVFEKDGSHYMFSLPIHLQEGWQLDDTVMATKVKPVVKTITEWVKDNG